MIAHVAERGEDRGRVVLQLSPSGVMSEVVVEAALAIAVAFRSEIESLFVEDSRLAEAAAHPFAFEIALSGAARLPIDPGAMARKTRASGAAMQQRVVELASRFEVPVRARSVEGTVPEALARACAESGPWNIVALAEPLARANAALPGDLLAAVEGTTGILISGAEAKCRSGPRVAIVEDIERVLPMRRTAGRLAEAAGEEACLVFIARPEEPAGWLEGQARLALGNDAIALEATPAREADPRAIAGRLCRKGAGLVLFQYGGGLVSGPADLVALASLLPCPVLLVR